MEYIENNDLHGKYQGAFGKNPEDVKITYHLEGYVLNGKQRNKRLT